MTDILLGALVPIFAPDLKVLPELRPGLESLWMGAGPVPKILHRTLNGLAWLVRLRLLPSLLPFSFLIHQVSNRVRWGEHRGGMFVEIIGTDSRGARVTRSWHLLAEGDDGPLIPSMGCQAILEPCLAGRPPAAGARAAIADLELEDYEALFARRTIYTGTRTSEPGAATQPLYQRILGSFVRSLNLNLVDELGNGHMSVEAPAWKELSIGGRVFRVDERQHTNSPTPTR